MARALLSLAPCDILKGRNGRAPTGRGSAKENTIEIGEIAIKQAAADLSTYGGHVEMSTTRSASGA